MLTSSVMVVVTDTAHRCYRTKTLKPVSSRPSSLKPYLRNSGTDARLTASEAPVFKRLLPCYRPSKEDTEARGLVLVSRGVGCRASGWSNSRASELDFIFYALKYLGLGF